MSESPPHKAQRRSKNHLSPADGLQRSNEASTSGAIAGPSSENFLGVPVTETYLSSIGGDDGDDDVADTVSLSESVRGHVTEAGLRYHKYHAGKYPFPNDEIEQDRDEMMNEMMFTLCRRYFFAPVHDVLRQGARVMDFGTGTGSWCLHLADLYSNSTFVGSDLSHIQPDTVPPNVHFVIDDFEHEEGWADEEESFEYIHGRRVLNVVHDLPELMKQIYDHLKPGGWVELQEFTHTIECDDSTCTEETIYRPRDFLEKLAQGMAVMGMDLHAINNIECHLRAAGFINIHWERFKAPIGRWPADQSHSYCGEIYRECIHDGLVGLARKPLMALNWTKLQTEMFLVEVRKQLNDSQYHVYMPFNIVYAQKPLAAAKSS